MKSTKILFGLFALLVFSIIGCKPDDPVLDPDNNSPKYDGVARVQIENYINRVFIDLIGREPLDAEMEAEVLALQEGELKLEARETLIDKLMFGTEPIEGDTTYSHAYFLRQYELGKARILEGLPDGGNPSINFYMGLIGFQLTILHEDSIADSLQQEIIQSNEYKIHKYQLVLDSKNQYRNDEIEIKDFYYRMLNTIFYYPRTNMDVFNLINSSFDNTLGRQPTSHEFDQAYNMVANHESRVLFQESGQSKEDYLNILTCSKEFHEGLVFWAYETFMAREPNAEEIEVAMQDFWVDHDLHSVIKKILVTDEYANID